MFAGDQEKGKTRIDYLLAQIESLTDFSHEIKHGLQCFTCVLGVPLLYLYLSLHHKYEYTSNWLFIWWEEREALFQRAFIYIRSMSCLLTDASFGGKKKRLYFKDRFFTVPIRYFWVFSVIYTVKKQQCCLPLMFVMNFVGKSNTPLKFLI